MANDQTQRAELRVGARAMELLHAWGGFAQLSELLGNFPDLQVYLAGGVVRDLVLQSGRKVKDFDFFAGGPSFDAAVQWLGRHGRVEFGPHGSPRWFPPGSAAQLYCDFIPIERFNNGLWRCQNMVDVLNQFDFTANAIAINLRDGALADPQNGLAHCLARSLRAVRFDYPPEPITPTSHINRMEVLWFRFVHYAAVLKFTIEPVTAAWLRLNQQMLQKLPVFRQTFFDPDLSAWDSIKALGSTHD